MEAEQIEKGILDGVYLRIGLTPFLYILVVVMLIPLMRQADDL